MCTRVRWCAASAEKDRCTLLRLCERDGANASLTHVHGPRSMVHGLRLVRLELSLQLIPHHSASSLSFRCLSVRHEQRVSAIKHQVREGEERRSAALLLPDRDAHRTWVTQAPLSACSSTSAVCHRQACAIQDCLDKNNVSLTNSPQLLPQCRRCRLPVLSAAASVLCMLWWQHQEQRCKAEIDAWQACAKKASEAGDDTTTPQQRRGS